jgi:hypothetical protein
MNFYLVINYLKLSASPFAKYSCRDFTPDVGRFYHTIRKKLCSQDYSL